MASAASQLTRAVMAPDPRQQLERLVERGWIAAHLPEIHAMADTLQGRGAPLHKDNLTHSIIVCAQTPARLSVRLAGLFHDVGKPPTRKLEGGKVTFRNHEAVGARLTREALTRLGYEAGIVEHVADVVLLSGRTHGFTGAWTDSAVRRIITEAGEKLDDLLDLSRADCTSRKPGRRDAVIAEVDSFARAAERIRNLDLARQVRPTLNGTEIAALLNVDGADLGAAWRWLRDQVAEGKLLDRDEAREALLIWSRTRPDC